MTTTMIVVCATALGILASGAVALLAVIDDSLVRVREGDDARE